MPKAAPSVEEVRSRIERSRSALARAEGELQAREGEVAAVRKRLRELLGCEAGREKEALGALRAEVEGKRHEALRLLEEAEARAGAGATT